MVRARVRSWTMKDFSKEPRVVEFTINRDVFRGKPHLAAQTMIDFTLKVEGIDEETASPEQGFETMRDALRMVLMPDSFKRLLDRMVDPANGVPDPEAARLERLRAWLVQSVRTGHQVSAEEALAVLDAPVDGMPDAPLDPDRPPVELPQLTEIVEWVMGEYGLRPTGPASGSSPGAPGQESGTNSTAPTSDVVSISAASPSTGS